MKNKNVLYTIIGVLFLTLFFGITKVNAEEYVNQAIWNGEFIDNVYIKKIKNDGTIKYEQGRFMRNRVSENYKKGKRTHIFIDEIHILFENEYSATFFNSAWRQFRKRNAYPTAITQNVEYLLSSVDASTMLSNSEFVVMLNQASSDRKELGKLLNISDEQMSYITNADAGCGLIRYGSSLVPFVNRFPKNTKLYKLMTTKPGE